MVVHRVTSLVKQQRGERFTNIAYKLADVAPELYITRNGHRSLSPYRLAIMAGRPPAQAHKAWDWMRGDSQPTSTDWINILNEILAKVSHDAEDQRD